MAKEAAVPAWQRAIIVLTGVVVGVIVLACLYFGQTVFIPVALAIFLTFLLSPLVTILQRRGLGRVPAVLVVVLLTAVVLSGAGYVIASQMVSMIEGLSKDINNIKAKASSLRALVASDRAGKLGQTVHEIYDAFTGQVPAPTDGTAEKKPAGDALSGNQQTVIIHQGEMTTPWWTHVSSAAGSITELLGQTLLTAVLVLFMLIKREDMRDRLIRLMGHGRLTVTTKAVDEAGHRVSRYLVTQLAINAVYGLVLSLGLFLIGIDHALLWGFLVALLRYIPYVGVWVGAIPPVLLSLAQFPGWWHPMLVFGLVLALELVTANFLEPRFYGQSMGVSEIALLVAAAFWAWMWGPIGLVLSSPLTVVLVVLGKYVPNLEFLDVLLGDEPPLEPHISYYQRLLARDQDEAAQLVLEQAKATSPEEVYDRVLVPTLTYVKRDRERDALTDADVAFILHATREIVEDLGVRIEAAVEKKEVAEQKQAVADQKKADAEQKKADAEQHQPAAEEKPVVEEKVVAAARPKMPILAFPCHDEADSLALVMLQQLLDPDIWEMEIAGFETMSTDLLAMAIEKKPLLICVSALPPGGLAHTRYLCKRLRARLPDVKLVVGRWGLQSNVDENKEQLREAGVDEVEITLLAMRDRLKSWLPVLDALERKEEHPATPAPAKAEPKLVPVG